MNDVNDQKQGFPRRRGDEKDGVPRAGPAEQLTAKMTTPPETVLRTKGSA